MNIPYLAQIETISACSSHCKMCGMRKMDRAKGKMKWRVFTKIIEDLREFDINTVMPFINGDLLMDNRAIDILNYINSELPNVSVVLYTNGLGLTEDIVKQMADIGNIKEFNMSVHGGNKNAYENVTGVKWEIMIDKLSLLVSTNKKLGHPFKLRAVMCDWSLTHGSIADFKLLCSNFGMEPHISYFSNFGGLIKDKLGEAPFADSPYKLCERSQFHIYILWDGTVTGCCFDVNAVHNFGNVNRQALKEIWQADKYKEFRQKHRDGRYKEIPVCKNCNSNRFGG